MKSSQPSNPSGSISDAAVAAKTGKTWPEWFAVLDAAGAFQMSHQEIVALLSQQYQVGPWWRQMVTVTYEQARGLRQKYESARGYQVSVSKTIAVPIEQLFAAWEAGERRAHWLPNPNFKVSRQTPFKSMRIAWVDGASRVEVNFYSKGETKSQVTVQHNQLSNAAEVETMRTYWSQALAALKKLLEKDGGQQ